MSADRRLLPGGRWRDHLFVTANRFNEIPDVIHQSVGLAKFVGAIEMKLGPLLSNRVPVGLRVEVEVFAVHYFNSALVFIHKLLMDL